MHLVGDVGHFAPAIRQFLHRREELRNLVACVDKAARSILRFLQIGYDEIEINYEEWAGDTPILHVSNRAAERGESLRLEVNATGDLDCAGHVRRAPHL